MDNLYNKEIRKAIDFDEKNIVLNLQHNVKKKALKVKNLLPFDMHYSTNFEIGINTEFNEVIYFYKGSMKEELKNWLKDENTTPRERILIDMIKKLMNKIDENEKKYDRLKLDYEILNDEFASFKIEHKNCNVSRKNKLIHKRKNVKKK
jgi:hypothetical protein